MARFPPVGEAELVRAALILMALAAGIALWKAGFGAPVFDGVTLTVFILCGLSLLTAGAHSRQEDDA